MNVEQYVHTVCRMDGDCMKIGVTLSCSFELDLPAIRKQAVTLQIDRVPKQNEYMYIGFNLPRVSCFLRTTLRRPTLCKNCLSTIGSIRPIPPAAAVLGGLATVAAQTIARPRTKRQGPPARTEARGGGVGYRSCVYVYNSLNEAGRNKVLL